jgi:hypothetical protein
MFPSLLQFSQTVELTEELYEQIQTDFFNEQHTLINDLPTASLMNILPYVKRHESKLLDSRIDEYIYTLEVESLSYLVTQSPPRLENRLLQTNTLSKVKPSSDRAYFIHVVYLYKAVLVIGKLNENHLLVSRAENKQAMLNKDKVDVFPVDISPLAIWSYQKIS